MVGPFMIGLHNAMSGAPTKFQWTIPHFRFFPYILSFKERINGKQMSLPFVDSFTAFLGMDGATATAEHTIGT